MSKAFSTFYDYLLPELPGCTTRMLDLQLLLVARDLCERTGCWRESLSPIEAETDRTDYPLSPPVAKTEVARVMRLTWGDRLQWAAIDPNPALLWARDSAACQQEPRYLAGEPPFTLNAAQDTITLIEQPEGVILIDATLRPALGATVLPDLLMTQHLETVRTGVLSRLMSMGGKPWSQPTQAALYATQFTSAINHAAMNAANGFTRAPMRTGRSKF